MVMKQATSLDLELGMPRPGIRITTSPSDYRPIKDLYLIRFDGRDGVPLGVGASSGQQGLSDFTGQYQPS